MQNDYMLPEHYKAGFQKGDAMREKAQKEFGSSGSTSSRGTQHIPSGNYEYHSLTTIVGDLKRPLG